MNHSSCYPNRTFCVLNGALHCVVFLTFPLPSVMQSCTCIALSVLPAVLSTALIAIIHSFSCVMKSNTFGLKSMLWSAPVS